MRPQDSDASDFIVGLERKSGVTVVLARLMRRGSQKESNERIAQLFENDLRSLRVNLCQL